ncbi:MAG: glycosyltransferase family 9 protein [Bauldia sp.]|nr:glycosyltransferase family 9 protein [Bauldia sp.]
MKIERILVIKVDHIGDFVLVSGAMADLRRLAAGRHLTLVCAPAVRELAAALGVFDEIVTFDFYQPDADSPSNKPHAPFARIARHVRGRYDLAIDLRHNADTRPLLDHVKARFRAGYQADGLARPLDLALPRFSETPSRQPERFGVHAETRAKLLVTAVADTFLPEIERADGRRRWRLPVGFGRSDYFLIAPGSRVRLKNWDAGSYARLADRLVRQLGLKAAIVGSESDRAPAETILAALGPEASIDLVGRLGLVEFRDMVARARLVVGNDSATTHIAARLGVPTVCVFSGVADHRIWRPRGPRVQLVRAPQPCAPCYLGDESRCAYAKACTRDITVPMVLAACHAVLGVPKNRRSSRRATNKSGSAG